jgi:ATP-dependent DNA helicase RecG
MPSSSSADARRLDRATPPAPKATAGWAGVGPHLAGCLAKLDIRGDRDLALHLPLRYEDETRLVSIRQAPPGQPVQVEGVVESCEVVLRPRRQLVARVADESGALTVRLLHFYPQQAKQLAPGSRLRLFGEIRGGFFGEEMVHPRIHPVAEGEALPAALTPVYPTTAGLAQSALRKLIGRALVYLPARDELLPAPLHLPDDLPDFFDALRFLHAPPPGTGLAALEDHRHPAWRRIKFEELLVQQLSLRRAHAARRAKTAPRLAGDGSLTKALLASLPFRLTGAQQRAAAEIGRELAAPHPMQRLLQGDVGSGKTIVAALAMLQAAESGWQAALMAPTEILAEQHYLKLAAWLAPLGVEVVWLSGSQKKKARAAMIERLEAGAAALAVGTHALIEAQVAFPRLGLAIVDEQHRFGVRQRVALRDKGAEGAGPGGSPHLLMMSATPIPRTLAMSYYADLDVSVLDELPPGRSSVVTKLAADSRREEVIGRVRDACLAGRQAYWVCPLIEESEALELQTALDTHATLSAALPELKVGLVHGRLKPAEKSATMAAFAAGEIHLLVATTVIEVGVDVPNASLMVIEHAERFGLAQLHQLRGRVGRGAAASACILLYAGPLSENGRARLKVIYENTDGFAIAREDLRLRGPGEFVGARQSGAPLLRYADLELDADLIELARSAAETLLRDDPVLVTALMERWQGGREGLLRA